MVRLPASPPAAPPVSAADRKAPLIGHRIRSSRRARGMTQVALAEAAGISPAYLNMIEHNKRPIAGALLLRLADALGLPSSDLTGQEESRMLSQLRAAAAEPLFRDHDLDLDAMPAVMGVAPDLLHAFATLHAAYRRNEEKVDALSEHVEALSERVSQDPYLAQTSHRILTHITSIRSFAEILRDYGDLDETERQTFVQTLVGDSRQLTDIATEMFSFLTSGSGDSAGSSPAQEVDELFYEHGNHFPALEDAADASRGDIDRSGGLLLADLLRHLEERHGVTVRRVVPDATAAAPAAWDAESRELHLSRALPTATARFLTARLVGRLEAADVVDRHLDTGLLSTEEARDQARDALAGYYAAALMFPYDAVVEAAFELRYDVELLQQRFAASWEQMCQRLTTLRRPGQEGIPLHFLRTDIAGNISKRFSASGLQLPRYGGACPRWAIHEALLTPGRVTTQLVALPDGGSYLLVARTVEKTTGGYRAPRSVYSVMIGCDTAFAPSMVYGDGLALDDAAAQVPVGVSCRQCPRETCRQRAQPAATPPQWATTGG
ncbi:transcriptional regulator, XRE family [Caenispirillum salinarum AK4]|uniref:histidine kinase n=1 Tax=Caenispirillum salinarum AK4 TaxID=1238182 RepID=K9HX81_9PROT|nr:short-chain fatty acyl-CoA regulator family protein [Caenispirillum salinarum]EKV32776.1 transcriptional regulator, XRE family [Caenispirillum salinarum AK4]